MHLEGRVSNGCSCEDYCAVFIGLRRNSGYIYSWTDGTPYGPMLYDNFSLEEPQFEDDCAEMRLDGKWYGVSCALERLFICEKSARRTT